MQQQYSEQERCRNIGGLFATFHKISLFFMGCSNLNIFLSFII